MTSIGIGVPYPTGAVWPSVLAQFSYFPRLYATCAAVRADPDAPSLWPIIVVPTRGIFVWQSVPAPDSGDELTDFIAFPNAGGGYALNSDVYRDYSTPSATPAYRAGRVWYDASSLNLMTDFSDVVIQIGEELQVQIYNDHDGAIPNGSVVYATGAQGQRLATDLLGNTVDDSASLRLIGLATHNVGNNGNGRATTFGLVRDLDTRSLTAGDELYTSDTPGAFTATEVPGDKAGARIGVVMNSHPTDGAVFVSPRILPRLASTTANLQTSPRVGTRMLDTTLDSLVVWRASGWGLANRPGYHDLVGDVRQAANLAALTAEAYRDTPEVWYWMHRAQDDALSITWQMPHDWDLGAVEPHLHVVGASTSTGNVRITGRYAWSHIGDLALPVWADWTPFATTTTITAAQQWTPLVISLATITAPVAARKPSAFLHLWLARPASSDVLDTYKGDKPDHTAAANLGLEGLDCHVMRSGLGTAGFYS